MNLFAIAFAILVGTYGNAEISKPDRTTEKKPIHALPTVVNKTALLQFVNEIRQKGCKCGDTYYPPVAAVTWNEQLAQAAFNHSEDMYRKKYFAHIAPDGSNGGKRIERVGYKWMAFGENIAAGYRNEKEVVRGWVESPGHCKNIMSKLFKEMGVARYGNYWAQEFGKRLAD